MTLAGVDGYKNGWVVVWDCDGITSVECVHSLQNILERNAQIAVVDIPIGLLEIGTREADRRARELLKKRSCCVFTAPIRPMLECDSYDLAAQCRKRTEGKSVTKQAWAILHKIKEADRLLTPELQQVVREGHPEVSFAVMNGGAPLAESKHTSAGQQARIKLLRASFPDVEPSLEQNRRMREDVIDSYAMLWTARRINNESAVALPESLVTDTRGLSMQIWA